MDAIRSGQRRDREPDGDRQRQCDSARSRSCVRMCMQVGACTGRPYRQGFSTRFLSEMALFSECMLLCARRKLDIADIVRDGDFLPIGVSAYELSSSDRCTVTIPFLSLSPLPGRTNARRASHVPDHTECERNVVASAGLILQ